MTSVRDELRRIHDMNNGQLTPDLVVKAAKPANAPLHNRFEWNDTIAGHKYRLRQAADLIREQRIEYARDARGSKTVRAYTSTYEAGSPNRGAYQATEDVMVNDFSAAIVLRNFERALADLKRQFGHLKEFGERLRREAG